MSILEATGGSLPDWIAAIGAGLAALFAGFALWTAFRSNGISAAANVKSKQSNQIAAAAADSARRSAAAAEASEARQQQAEARSLEIHEVEWSPSWDVSAPLDIHPHTVDRSLHIFQYGPDDAFDVTIHLYVGAFH